LFGYRLLSLFLLAAVIRFAVVLFFAPKIKEVRPVKNVSSWDLMFNVIGLKPALE